MERRFRKGSTAAIVFFLLLCASGQGQPDAWANNNSARQNPAKDTARISSLISEGESLFNSLPDSSFSLWMKALDLIDQYNSLQPGHPLYKNLLSYKSNVLNNLGTIYQIRGENQEAIELLKECIRLDEKTGELQGMAHTMNNIGAIYQMQSLIPEALDYYHKALKLLEKTGDTMGVAHSRFNIGMVYQQLKNYQDAMGCYEKSLAIWEKYGFNPGIAHSLSNMGFISLYTGEQEKALGFFIRSLRINEAIGDKKAVGEAYNSLGTVYMQMGNYAEAGKWYVQSRKIREEMNDKTGLTEIYANLGKLFIARGNYSSALDFATKSLSVAREIGFPDYIKNSAGLSFEIYKKMGRHREALEMRELYVQMRDSINSEQNRKSSIKKQFQYEYEKKASADSVKNLEAQKVKDAQLLAQNAQLKQEKFQRYSLFAGLLFVAAGLVFVINRFRLTQKQKKIIEEQKVVVDEAYEKLSVKNKEVLDSIYYARRIQRALITSEKYIERKLNEKAKNSRPGKNTEKK